MGMRWITNCDDGGISCRSPPTLAPVSPQVAVAVDTAPIWCHPWQTWPTQSQRRDPGMSQRFRALAHVAEILNISATQTYALVRRGDLPAIKIGGRGQWRVEQRALAGDIERVGAANGGGGG